MLLGNGVYKMFILIKFINKLGVNGMQRPHLQYAGTVALCNKIYYIKLKVYRML